MWKIVVGFILFAALALFILNRGGDIDMGGEKHGGLAPVLPVFLDLRLVEEVRLQVFAA